MIYAVISYSHSVEIVNFNDGEVRTCEEYNFQGSFDSFAEAKKLALKVSRTKVANFKYDYEEAKEAKRLLSKIEQRDLE